MPLITDPDLLTQGTEVVFDTTARTITLNIAGNLDSSGVTLKALYSFTKEEWRTSPSLIRFPFPFIPITDEQYELVNGWNFGDSASKFLIRTGGWAVKNTSGNTTEEWAGIITLGSIESNDQIYFQQSAGGAATDFELTGPVNQSVQIFSDPNGDGNTADGYNRRSYMKLFVREWQQLYDTADLADIGVTGMTYQVYRFPLTTGADLKVTVAETGIDANADGTADVAPFSGMDITYYGTNQNRTIGVGSYPFRVIIDGNNATAEQIYQFVQWSLRKDGDIDAGAGTVTGKTADDILFFVGDTLKTRPGVYIDNFNPADTNRLTFTDFNGIERTFPFVASLTVNFGANLVADPSAVYRVFFTSNPAGNFGTSNAVLVEDNSDVVMSGNVSGQSSITLTFDYDGNVQGGRTAGTDANITAVAIGLSTGQYVSATGTIVRSTANQISLVAPLERNYANP
jgi:hypothetical protein